MGRGWIGVAGLSVAVWALPALAEAAEIKIEVQGFKKAGGYLGCALFKPGGGFPDGKPFKRTRIKVTSTGTHTCLFKDIAPGTYATSVLHDANGNGKMDTTFVGMPEEMWAVSNNAQAHTFGPPEFDEAKYVLPEAGVVLKLKLNEP